MGLTRRRFIDRVALAGGYGAAYVTRADGPFYFAGEHVSYLRAWQEGAILSAHHSIAALHERVQGSGGCSRI